MRRNCSRGMLSRVVIDVSLHTARVSTSGGTDVWVVVAALGAAVGAVAGAVAAVAAWRSANASRATSRDALDALAVGIRPALSVRTQGDVVDDKPTGKVWLTIANESLLHGWAASNLVLEIRYRDGHVDRYERERMNPPGPDSGLDLWRVPIRNGEPSAERANESNIYGDTRERVECVVLTYSDERGVARYELRLTPAPGGYAVLYATAASSGTPHQVRRLIELGARKMRPAMTFTLATSRGKTHERRNGRGVNSRGRFVVMGLLLLKERLGVFHRSRTASVSAL